MTPDHGSHSRSALAWKTAAQEWPAVTWLWARWKDGKWDETMIKPTNILELKSEIKISERLT
jgi:hypothetical protein